MDEDIAIINSNTRNQRIKDFFIKNKKLLISVLIFLILILLGFYSYQIYQDKNKINSLFDILINKTSLDSEIKNLIIYKKALYNADTINEGQILEILNPIINSKSVWKSHALYLIAEYFYSKGEKQKSKEFFSQIITLENANLDILKETQKRLNRDLSE